jgi:hypothetical protein
MMGFVMNITTPLAHRTTPFAHRTTPFAHREVYNADALRALSTVFENAWASIEYNFDPGSRAAARLKLAKIIFQLAATGDRDLLELRCRAIGAMQVRCAP